jgi:predicted nucleotidyltransferase
VISEVRAQVDEIVSGLDSALDEDLVGVYLHGSAVLDCMGPWSDIDLLAVVENPLDADAKRRVAEVVLRTSGGYKRQGPRRPVELDVVRAAALREWRHPAPFEFHYSESFRERFAAGEVEPWDATTNRDLAAHVAVLRESGVALTGPSPRKLFPPVPDEDLRDALLYELEWTLRGDIWLIPGAIRNTVLTRARIWATLSTGELHSKLTGAKWALPRLSKALRTVLQHALEVYRGTEQDDWDDLPLDDFITAVDAEIQKVIQPR